MLGKTLLFLAVPLFLLASSPARTLAQSNQTERGGTESSASATQQQPDPASADLAITANVTARELRFEVVPNPDVKFTGQPERNTVWEAVRQNLPGSVQPGVTYRDIGVRLKIVSVFADIDRIVAEALGEALVSDKVPAGGSAVQTQEGTEPVPSTPQPVPPAPAPPGEGKPE